MRRYLEGTCSIWDRDVSNVYIVSYIPSCAASLVAITTVCVNHCLSVRGLVQQASLPSSDRGHVFPFLHSRMES